MFLNFFMNVLVVCHNAGMEVAATGCDMGSNSVKALKLLGVSEKISFFRFQSQEKLQLYLVFPGCLNVPTNLSYKMM
jgi:hypothetical protein